VKYGSFTALDNLTVNVPAGCIGLLGPNGAGKTTLLKTVLGFVQPASGTATVLGHSIETEGKFIRQKIGLMPEQDCHIPGMSAVRFVAYAGELSGMPKAQALRRAHEVLEYCGLGEARYRQVETYSTGMKQRIKFAQALVHGPKLLLLDEPTNGLDPKGRDDMLELVRTVCHDKGLSAIVSSHLLPDVERTCDQVIVLMKGTVRAQGLISDLKKLQGFPVDVELREPNPNFTTEILQAGVKLISAKSASFRLLVPGNDREISKTVQACARKAGAQVRGLSRAERTLEEIFLTAVQDQNDTSHINRPIADISQSQTNEPPVITGEN